MTDKSHSSIVRRTSIPNSASEPLVTPLMPSVVYTTQTPDALDDQYEGRTTGYTYAREGHPNADVLARKIDQLEGAEGGLILGSGMAAVTATMMGLLKAGDHVLGGDQLYGRSLRMMAEELPRFGVETTLADPTDVDAMRAAIQPNTRIILVEVVSNPTLRVADMDGIAQLAKDCGALLVVDNTFTTPRGYKPFEHGADIVIHSVTKLLAGHSDVTLGYVAARDPALMQQIVVTATTFGLTPSPFDCWLAERGLHSFDLRFDRASANAAILADALAECPGVKRVLYPGRADHPDHNRTVSVLQGEGGNMVSFELHGGRPAANAMTTAAEHIAFGPTLGDVATVLSHSASSSHRALTPEGRAALGISEGFFRVSVGIEDPELLVREFTAAIAEAQHNL
ncbi:MAG: aminotransferase class I/II-fold pyridoxal phosphate-dependent enzyme [Paracoccaceae bacterium]|jgi:cystathionine gamma-synthase|nr:aminotransferase class I/II-fold pyridoxal phosphate-dependent enzyme [Paracoccaceae bacterium]